MFKKIFIALFLFLFLTMPVCAEGTVVQLGDDFITFGPDMQTAEFTITSDAGSVPLTAFSGVNRGSILGWYLMTVEMKSATDDAFVVLITTNQGSELFTYTTTAATTGHLKNAADIFPINSTPKIDVTGLAAGESCTVIVTFVR